jgi:hypothetical protein
MTDAVKTYPEQVTVPDDEENHQESEEVGPEPEVIDPVIDPPPSRGEHFRDWILSTLDLPFFQALGLLVLFLVVGTGALFFFFLMGWQTVCRPRTDCEPRNWWYNWSIQALNVCFTYMATVSLPWRTTNAIHTFGWGCPHQRCWARSVWSSNARYLVPRTTLSTWGYPCDAHSQLRHTVCQSSDAHQVVYL